MLGFVPAMNLDAEAVHHTIKDFARTRGKVYAQGIPCLGMLVLAQAYATWVSLVGFERNNANPSNVKSETRIFARI